MGKDGAQPCGYLVQWERRRLLAEKGETRSELELEVTCSSAFSSGSRSWVRQATSSVNKGF